MLQSNHFITMALWAFIILIRNAHISRQYYNHLVSSMLIFNKEPPKPPPASWDAQLKQQLIARCHSFLTTHTREETLIDKPRLWSNMEASGRLTEQHSYSVTDYGHGAYAEYVSVRNNYSGQSDELEDYFPHFKRMNESRSEDYQKALLFLANTVRDRKDHAGWRRFCREYLVDLTVGEMFHYYYLLLHKGMAVLSRIARERGVVCCREALLGRIMEVRRFCLGGSGVAVGGQVGVSLERGEEITLQNMSKTMKCLFCPICMVYDCQHHLNCKSVVEHHYQYIRPYDVRHRLQNKKITVQALYKQFVSILNDEAPEGEACSQKCYRHLRSASWQRLKQERNRLLTSPIFKSVVRMGVEMFHYSPCSIARLLCGKESTCELVFYHLVEEEGVWRRLERKFYPNQQEQLLSQSKAPLCLPVKRGRRERGKRMEQPFNSLCFHYFLDQPPFDTTCLLCECQTRGYCLPSCGCSQLCDIRRVGCRCKSESSCWENRCPCFKAGVACLPGVCENCLGGQQGPRNWCHNNEERLSRGKLLRVGQSSVAGGGLGLFAGEAILKGEFVTQYVGEVVRSASLRVREQLVEDNLCYAFKLDEHDNLDSRMFGNKARFINHAPRRKDDNVTPKAISVGEQQRIVFHALRDIQEGQQLFFNYNGGGEFQDHRDRFPFIKE